MEGREERKLGPKENGSIKREPLSKNGVGVHGEGGSSLSGTDLS